MIDLLARIILPLLLAAGLAGPDAARIDDIMAYWTGAGLHFDAGAWRGFGPWCLAEAYTLPFPDCPGCGGYVMSCAPVVDSAYAADVLRAYTDSHQLWAVDGAAVTLSRGLDWRAAARYRDAFIRAVAEHPRGD